MLQQATRLLAEEIPRDRWRDVTVRVTSSAVEMFRGSVSNVVTVAVKLNCIIIIIIIIITVITVYTLSVVYIVPSVCRNCSLLVAVLIKQFLLIQYSLQCSFTFI